MRREVDGDRGQAPAVSITVVAQRAAHIAGVPGHRMEISVPDRRARELGVQRPAGDARVARRPFGIDGS